MIDGRIGVAILLSAISAILPAEAANMVGDAASTCSGLAGPAGDAVQIDSSALQSPSSLLVSERAPTPSGRIAPAGPAFCKVLGHIAPTDPKAPPIKFEVNLPADWNGRSRSEERRVGKECSAQVAAGP